MLRKARTLLGYLARPRTYPFLARLIRTRLSGGSMSPEDSGPQAREWCRRRAVGTSEALGRLGWSAGPQVREQFADELARADEAVAACEQRMGGAAAVDLLFALAEASGATRVIETGVAYGWSSLVLLLSLRSRDGRLVSTNLHYREMGDDDASVGCAVPDDLRGGWTIIREPDTTAVPKAIAEIGAIDLCHYDSDKSYAGRMAIYPLLWQALSVGGLFVSDDVGDNLAFAHFARLAREEPLVVAVDEKFAGILVKRTDRPLRDLML